jgi:hypothetical protein
MTQRLSFRNTIWKLELKFNPNTFTDWEKDFWKHSEKKMENGLFSIGIEDK